MIERLRVRQPDGWRDEKPLGLATMGEYRREIFPWGYGCVSRATLISYVLSSSPETWT